MLVLAQSLAPPPRRLAGLAAARALFHRVGSSVLFIAGAVFLLAGGVATAVLVPAALRERALARSMTPATATIVSKRAFNQTRDGDERRVHEAAFEFVLPDGRTWSGVAELDRAEWNRTTKGDRLDLRYDPRDPDRNSLSGGGGTLPIAAAFLPLIFVALGAALFRQGAREVLLPVRLYRTGEAATGRITGLEIVTQERMNGHHPVRVSYRFTDGGRDVYQGSVKTFDDRLLDALPEGAEATVLYDRRDPSRNTLLASLRLSESRESRGRTDLDSGL